MLAAQFYPQQPVLAISFPVTLQASMLSLNQPPHFPSLSSDPGRITSDFACSLVVVAPSSGYFQNKTSSAASVGPPTKGNDVSDAEAALDATVSNQPPRYVCPDEVDPADLFFCFDCGGAVSVTQWLNNGEANAKCGGLENGMWKDCPCYEVPDLGLSSQRPPPHLKNVGKLPPYKEPQKRSRGSKDVTINGWRILISSLSLAG